ncbi:MAG: cupin domain-containing protein [Alphaproteobacteria bacterium]
MTQQTDDLAAELALGVLSGASLRAARVRAASDPAFAAAVESWQRRLAALDRTAPEADPPAGLLEEIEARIDAEADWRSATVTVRGDEGAWQPMAPGVEYKRLWRHPDGDRETIIVRVAAGAVYDAHHHSGHEECYIVAGDVRFGDHQLRAGDFHVAQAGVTHPAAASQGGCLLLISRAA